MGLKYSFWVLAFLLVGQVSGADRAKKLYTKAKEASVQFAKNASAGKVYKFKVDTLKMDPKGKRIDLQMTATFAEIPFRPEDIQRYYTDYKNLLGRKFRKSNLSI